MMNGSSETHPIVNRSIKGWMGGKWDSRRFHGDDDEYSSIDPDRASINHDFSAS